MGNNLLDLKELIKKEASKKEQMRVLGCYQDDQLVFLSLELINNELKEQSIDYDCLKRLFTKEQIKDFYCSQKDIILDKIAEIETIISTLELKEDLVTTISNLKNLKDYLIKENDSKLNDYYRFRNLIFRNKPYPFLLHMFDELIKKVKEEPNNPSLLECAVAFSLSAQGTEYEEYSILILKMFETSECYSIPKSLEKRIKKDVLNTKSKMDSFQNIVAKKESIENAYTNRQYNVIIPGNYPENMEYRKRDIKIPNLVDKTQEDIFTIDYKKYGIFDDAFSLTKTSAGTYRLTAYSADVAHQIPFGEEEFENAFIRSRSIYKNNRLVYSMFPMKLCREFSLTEREFRYAIAYQIDFDRSFHPKLTKIENTIICVNRNFTIDEINMGERNNFQYFSKNSREKLMFVKQFMEEIKDYRNNEKRHLYHQMKEALREIQDPTLGWHGYSSNSNLQYRTFAQNIVEEFESTAGKAIAEYAALNNLPFAYRNCDIAFDCLLDDNATVEDFLKHSKFASYYMCEKCYHAGTGSYHGHVMPAIRNDCCLTNQYSIVGIWKQEMPPEVQAILIQSLGGIVAMLNIYNTRNQKHQIEEEFKAQCKNQKRMMYH